jgi:hypothetical protein
MDIKRVTANRNLFAKHVLCRLMAGMACMIVASYSSRATAPEEAGRFMAHYEESIQPLLETYCYECHDNLTPFSSLELTCDDVRTTGGCDSGYACAYMFNLAWKTPTTPVTPEPNPRLVFERMFGAGAPGERKANLMRRMAQQKSILDYVLEDAASLVGGMSSGDKVKMICYASAHADGNRHTHDNLPIILAGSGGGALTPARYNQFSSQPVTNLFLGMADRMGCVGIESHGDSNGRVESI